MKNSILVFFAFVLILIAAHIDIPKSYAACSCSTASASGCCNTGDVCGILNQAGSCVKLANQIGPDGKAKCGCKVSTGPTVTPRAPTSIPGQPSVGWFAPDGSPCNRTNYYAYYALSSCTGKAGFVTEGITPQSNCSNNGSGKCFLVTGNTFAQLSKSLWKNDTQSCNSVQIPTTPSNAFDTLFQCRFGLAPDSSINGTVTSTFTNTNQFEKIYVWIVDSQVGWSQYFELPNSQITSGRAVPYNFNNLFSDKKYDVYVKAYGPAGIYLDKVTYTGSCGSPGCRSYPNVQFNFILNFPKPLAGSKNNFVTNQAFQDMIDKWIGGQISPLQMSLFISQIGRVPGLQKATCDPKFPGGCNP